MNEFLVAEAQRAALSRDLPFMALKRFHHQFLIKMGVSPVLEALFRVEFRTWTAMRPTASLLFQRIPGSDPAEFRGGSVRYRLR